MDTDLALGLGLLVCGFSAPSLLSAIVDGRAPRTATVVLMMGGVLVVYALSQKPGGYRFGDIPKAFIRVIADVI